MSRNLISLTSFSSRYIFASRFSTARICLSRSSTVPKERADVPDVKAFLERIGRDSIEHLEAFENDWSTFWNTDSKQMKEKGLDASARRYILSWREKYMKGQPLETIKQGVKKNGGERKQRAVLAQKRFEKIKGERQLREEYKQSLSNK